MPQSALKTRDKQMLPSVAAALRRDKQREGGISFREPNGSVFDPNSTRAIAKREAKSVVNVGVEKYISVAGEDVTEARRPKPRSIRRRTGGLSTGGGLESRMASPLRDRGITFGDQHDGGSLAMERKYKPESSANFRYRKPSGNTPPQSPGNWDQADPPEKPAFAERSWRVRKGPPADAFAGVEKRLRQESRKALEELERHVVGQMMTMRANDTQHARQESRINTEAAKAQVLQSHKQAFQIGRLEQEIAHLHRTQMRQPGAEVVQRLRQNENTLQASIVNNVSAVHASKAAAVQARRQEVQAGKIVVEKTKAAREDYYRRVHAELGIKSAVADRGAA
eukprot:Tamp_14175.p1 GENE.Tamp_14175~~Tamp_14175.p1  ORF type:complete len:380 (-),score=93.76 Tamp_14175:511-1524(-)